MSTTSTALTIRTHQDTDGTFNAQCDEYPQFTASGFLTPRGARIALKQMIREAKAAEAGR